MAVGVSIAALAVSFLALLASGVALIRGERREGGRRHDELKPRLSATYDYAERDKLQFVRLVNNGPLPYASVEVTLVQPQYGWDERFNDLMAISEEGAEPQQATSVVTHSLLVGEMALIGLVESGKKANEDNTIRLRCICTEMRRRRPRRWQVLVECEAPGVPRISVI